MIRFTCHECGRAFAVRDADAGRRAKCKACGTEVVVPPASEAAAQVMTGSEPADVATAEAVGPAAAGLVSEGAVATEVDVPRRIPMRIRRLTADAQQMRAAFADFPLVRLVSTEGDPPERYKLEYRVKGLERGKSPDKPVPRDVHLVEIQLTSEYPRVSPACRMLTPVFHPNIDPATICVGDHWAAGERLVDLAVRIGEMLAYQAYNIKSPLDAEAAMWADLHPAELPTDPRGMRPAEV